MSIKDINLEKKLLSMMLKLERKIDHISPTPLRQELSAKLVNMRITLIRFDQRKYDGIICETQETDTTPFIKQEFQEE